MPCSTWVTSAALGLMVAIAHLVLAAIVAMAHPLLPGTIVRSTQRRLSARPRPAALIRISLPDFGPAFLRPCENSPPGRGHPDLMLAFLRARMGSQERSRKQAVSHVDFGEYMAPLRHHRVARGQSRDLAARHRSAASRTRSRPGSLVRPVTARSIVVSWALPVSGRSGAPAKRHQMNWHPGTAGRRMT